MIRIFNETDKTFDSNGDVSFVPFKALVRKTDNSDYYLTLECDLKYVDYLKCNNIVVADLPQGSQAFRIGDVQINGKKLTSKCYHVFYDTKNYLIADSYVENKNGDYAIKWLNNHTNPTSDFTVSSDITTLNSYRCVRTSLYEAITKSMLERWGGHIVRDNFDIQLKADISRDNGIVVRYRKNLKEITRTESWTNVVTRILPVGKEGVLLNSVNPSASIYIDSTTQYDRVYCKTVSFSQVIDKDDYPTEQEYYQALVNDLRSQATAYVNKYCMPSVNYTLKANLETITDIGDVIEVIDERLGVNLLTNVTAFEYDCVLNKYKTVEFGNFKNNLSNLMSNIQGMINNSITERQNNG